MPTRLTLPKVGLRPTIPQRLAGTRIDPPVSLPSAPAQRPPATAAPEPPLDPPGIRLVSHGLRVGGHIGPHANSCMRVLPSRIAPAARSRATAAESTLGNVTPGAVVPTVVGMSAVR